MFRSNPWENEEVNSHRLLPRSYTFPSTPSIIILITTSIPVSAYPRVTSFFNQDNTDTMIALPKDGKSSEVSSADPSMAPPPSYTSVVTGPSASPHTTYHPAGPYINQGPSGQVVPYQSPAGQQMHYYYNPVANRMIATSLGPQTPEMVCLVEGHEVAKRFGIFGVLAAVAFFPWGLAFCALDRKSICTRCQKVLNGGCLP